MRPQSDAASHRCPASFVGATKNSPSWRTTKVDRGDTYVDKHWFEFTTPEGATVTVYFHRRATRGQPRWWLYTIDP
jgi:hypothetical protein